MNALFKWKWLNLCITGSLAAIVCVFFFSFFKVKLEVFLFLEWESVWLLGSSFTSAMLTQIITSSVKIVALLCFFFFLHLLTFMAIENTWKNSEKCCQAPNRNEKILMRCDEHNATIYIPFLCSASQFVCFIFSFRLFYIYKTLLSLARFAAHIIGHNTHREYWYNFF